MPAPEPPTTWVVYHMTLPGNAVGGNVMCSQQEWDRIEKARPGYHTLLYSGIKTEQEAERLARGAAGDTKPRGDKKKTEGKPPDTPAS